VGVAHELAFPTHLNAIGALTDPTLNPRVCSQSEPLCAILRSTIQRPHVKREYLAKMRQIFIPGEFGLQALVGAILADIRWR